MVDLMRRLSFVLVLAMVALATSPGALAVQPDEILGDATLETRARALSKELRCMVCQNQSIDDSDAPLARDLRVLVRERLQAGDSDYEVINFLVSRYGAVAQPRGNPAHRRVQPVAGFPPQPRPDGRGRRGIAQALARRSGAALRDSSQNRPIAPRRCRPNY
jgi:hypothetical protein